MAALQLGAPLSFALLVAIFVFVGALTHLILDECYSVDLANNRLKASFGSAIKIIDIRFPLATLAQAGVVGAGSYYLYQQYGQILVVVAKWQAKLGHLVVIPNF